MTMIVFALIITALSALIFWLLRAEWRETQIWSPFDRDGHLHPMLFVPVDRGGYGFHRLGALREDDE